MIGFWVSAGAMVLIVALVLWQALHQAGPVLALPGRSADLAVYRDQLAEVTRDQARGILAESEAERLRLEVQRRMLDADRIHRGSAKPVVMGATLWTIVAVALGLAAAVAVYVNLGVPGYPDLPLASRLARADAAYLSRPSQDEAEAAQPAFAPPADLDPELAALIAKLRAVVAARPYDVLGQALLAENEASLGNFAAARVAQAEVVRQKGQAATGEDYAQLAGLMIAAAGGVVTPQAEQALIQCLRLDPRNGWARYYSGLMFAEIGRPDRSFGLWEPLLRDSPMSAPWLAPLRDQIQGVAAAAGINYSLPDTSDAAAIAGMNPTDQRAMIQTMVDGLEQRLTSSGGPVEDWTRLITSLGVLKQDERARAAYATAQMAFEGKPGELAALRAAAVQAGVVP